MSLKVIKAGILDTIQDAGRYGYQHLGINPGGVMDPFSAAVANLLAGNKQNTALIELHFPVSVFLFQQQTLIAIAGANFSPVINGESIPIHQPIIVSKNSVLQFQKIKAGARAYLAVHNGVNVASWLGSCSTNLKAAVGGFHGRALQKNDEIYFNSGSYTGLLQGKDFITLPWKADVDWENTASTELFFLPGNEWDRLSADTKAKFPDTLFHITNQSDRMGYRLDGTPIFVANDGELVSSGVTRGTIQLLPNGQLIILMADHQTVGGYPRIGHVISAHLPKLAQRSAGDSIQFKITSTQEAERLFLKQQQHLQQLQNACTLKLKEYIHVP